MEKKKNSEMIEWLKSRIFDKKCKMKYWNVESWMWDWKCDEELLEIMEGVLEREIEEWNGKDDFWD